MGDDAHHVELEATVVLATSQRVASLKPAAEKVTYVLLAVARRATQCDLCRVPVPSPTHPVRNTGRWRIRVVSDQAKFEFMPFLAAECPNWDVPSQPEMTDIIKIISKAQRNRRTRRVLHIVMTSKLHLWPGHVPCAESSFALRRYSKVLPIYA